MKVTRRNIKASYEPDTYPDLYVVKIWHEIDPGHDVAVPEAAEEIIAVFANSPQEAMDYAKMQWDGPIDKIEIVDINPEGVDEEIPFEACSDITASDEPEFFGVGGHLKNYLKHRAAEDAETGSIMTGFRQFEKELAAAGFDDIDPEEVEEAFKFYDYIVEQNSGCIDACDAIQASELVGKKNLSRASFDFAHDGYYSEDDIDRAIRLAFEDFGVEVINTDYYAVDYSRYLEYVDYSVTQVDVDFTWDEAYAGDYIEARLNQELSALGYDLLGIDFRSLN